MLGLLGGSFLTDLAGWKTSSDLASLMALAIFALLCVAVLVHKPPLSGDHDSHGEAPIDFEG